MCDIVSRLEKTDFKTLRQRFQDLKNVRLPCRRSALLAGGTIEESCDTPRNIISRRVC